jgi:PKD repeat protein
VDPDGAITKYEWDFDNDGTYDLDSAATATAQHTYAAPGTYVARVRVTDDGTPALSGTATATISVGQANQAPTVSVSANPASGVGPLAVTFTATAADSDGEIAKYEWDFDNDGTFDFDSGTTATAQHTYPTAGAFTVRVRVTDNGTPALQATATTGVTVNANQAPSVSVAALPDAGKVPLTVDFTATAADADGSIAKYEWDFENDGEFDLDSGTTPTANHVYPSSGTFTCLVRVTDDGNPGLTASATVDVTANANQPPAVTLDSEVTEGKGPLTVIFTAAGSDPDGTITKYEWDFDNDGTFETDTGTTPTAQHVYPVAAEIDEGHTCRVRVTDDGTPDLTATAARSITVHPNQAPTVSLQANPSQDNSPVLVTFTATASDPDGSITRYEWDWDNDGTYDEDTGTTPTAQHTFTFNEQGGPYTIGVRVTDDGVPDRMAFATTQVTVDPPNQAPTAILFPSDEGGSAPLTLTFDGSQSFDNDGVITKYEWDWDGDGVYDEDSGTTSTVQHTYTVPGQYHVTLRVTDDGNPLLTGVSEEFIIFVFGGD